MELTKSEARALERLRKASSRSAAWALGGACLAFLAIGIGDVVVLAAYLRQHGQPLARLFATLAEAQHSSDIRILFICNLLVLIAVMFLSALGFAFACAMVFHRAEDRKLVEKLLAECTHSP